MKRDRDALYQPPGAVSEALSSYYVRHVVQSAIDHAFKLHANRDKENTGVAAS